MKKRKLWLSLPLLFLVFVVLFSLGNSVTTEPVEAASISELQEQLEAAPRKARIYYTAFDMMSRYPQLRRELAGVTAQFRKNISDPDAYDFAVWTLLGRFDFDSAALAGAAALYGDSLRLSRNMKRSSDSLAGHYSSGALLAARLGDLKKAVELQGRALEYRRSSGNTSAVFAAEKMLEYFIQCAKTAVKW